MLFAHVIWDYKEPIYNAIVGPFQNNKHASRWRRLMDTINGKGKDRIHPRMDIRMQYTHDPGQFLSSCVTSLVEDRGWTEEEVDEFHNKIWDEWHREKGKTWADR